MSKTATNGVEGDYIIATMLRGRWRDEIVKKKAKYISIIDIQLHHHQNKIWGARVVYQHYDIAEMNLYKSLL